MAIIPPQRDRARRLRGEPSWLTQLKLGFALAGVILWAYGARADIEWLRWAGIGFLALSVFVRLWFRRRDERLESPPSDDSEPR
jgi:hypothetical protein